MASLVELSKAPETLYLILQYLSNADLFALLRTCKSLYPASFLELWSALVFDETNSRIYPGRGIGYFRGCLIFQSLIETEGADNLGFKYTKYLGMGSAMFNDGFRNLDSGIRKLRLQIGELLESGELAPQTVDVRFDGMDTPTDHQEESAQMLLSLKNYSETKSSGELSISVTLHIVRSLDDFFDLEKIVKYDLCAYYGNSRKKTWTADDTDIGSHIVELTEVLARLVNLKYFSWNIHSYQRTAFQLSQFSKELDDLQAAFSNMQHLERLFLWNNLFHPSFFLTPPKTVRKLKYGGVLSHRWWKKFSVCPLDGVEYLDIIGPDYFEAAEVERFLEAGEEFQDIRNLFLSDVAVTGLQGFGTKLKGNPHGRGCLPVDLEECILRRNKGLEERYLEIIAEVRAKDLINSCWSKISEKFSLCESLLVGKYTAELFAAGSAEEDTHQITQEYLSMLVQDHNTRRTEFEAWSAGRDRADEFASNCRWRLQQGLDGCIAMVQDEYTRRFADGEDLNQTEFTKKCLQMLSKWPELDDSSNWGDVQSRVSGFVGNLTDRMRDKVYREQHHLIKEYTARFLEGERADIESLTDEWTRRLVKDIGGEDARLKATLTLVQTIDVPGEE